MCNFRFHNFHPDCERKRLRSIRISIHSFPFCTHTSVPIGAVQCATDCVHVCVYVDEMWQNTGEVDDKAMEILQAIKFSIVFNTYIHSFIQHLMLVCVCICGLGATLQA